MQHGLLLINIGTPNSPAVNDVSAYLRRFLTDKRVINLPSMLRYMLVYGYIVPFRAKQTALNYKAIWTKDGSPLLHYSKGLISALQSQLDADFTVRIGMHYGKPSIQEAFSELAHCQSVTILPLYPQYSSAATGSAIEKTLKIISSLEVMPSLQVIDSFYQHPAFIKVQAKLIKKHLQQEDHLLFSYHGLPEQQLIAAGCKSICTSPCPNPLEKNPGCYKAQCHQTSHLLANELGLESRHYSSSFQSRIGRLPWIKPYTDEVLTNLARQGIKNLVVSCPSFVTDCLETLEEIGLRAKEQWHSLGGERFVLVPSLNNDPAWAKAITEIIA